MEKVDCKKRLKHLYVAPPKEVVTVDVPRMNFLMVDGKGDPNTSKDYRDSIEALYSVAYALKFMVKKQGKADYVVMPLESLWWVPNMDLFSEKDKDSWLWTSMIMQPKWVTREQYEEADKQAGKKKNLPALSRMRFESFDEGLSAQMMHIGPFSEEGPTVEKIHRYIEAEGHRRRGKHHEIYLSDMRRVAPAKMKTIVRQPME